MVRFALIGPTYPYRGGIAHYTTLLARHLRQDHELLFISFSRQYPGWLFPGRSDKDPSTRPLRTAAEYILDPINPLTWRQTLKRLQAYQPDVVIIPWWHPYFAPAWMAVGRGIKRLPSQPRLVFICHNVLPHEQSRVSKILLPATIRHTLGRGDYFIVHSQMDGQILQQLLPQARYDVTPLPTYAELGDTDTQAVIIPVDIPEDRPLLLFCGFVRPYKGLDVLLEAFAFAIQKRPLHLLVAGEFWQGGETQYQQQINHLDLNDHVTILNDYLPDELLAACIDRSDVVVLPYRSATQSAIMQMALGRECPVITTNVGGLAEAITNDYTGLVVPPENSLALAKAIERYFERDLQPIFVENIRQGNGRFAWKHLSKALLK